MYRLWQETLRGRNDLQQVWHCIQENTNLEETVRHSTSKQTVCIVEGEREGGRGGGRERGREGEGGRREREEGGRGERGVGGRGGREGGTEGRS